MDDCPCLCPILLDSNNMEKKTYEMDFFKHSQSRIFDDPQDSSQKKHIENHLNYDVLVNKY